VPVYPEIRHRTRIREPGKLALFDRGTIPHLIGAGGFFRENGIRSVEIGALTILGAAEPDLEIPEARPVVVSGHQVERGGFAIPAGAPDDLGHPIPGALGVVEIIDRKSTRLNSSHVK